MTIREVFTQFQNDLRKLNQEELTIVTYDKDDHTLTYRQFGKVFTATYLRLFYKPSSSFKIGVLTPHGYVELINAIQKLIADESVDLDQIIPDIQPLGTDWYRCFNDRYLPTPEKYISLKYVNVTGEIWSWIVCHWFNENSRILYKFIKNERKALKRFNESQKDSKKD